MQWSKGSPIRGNGIRRGAQIAKQTVSQHMGRELGHTLKARERLAILLVPGVVLG